MIISRRYFADVIFDSTLQYNSLSTFDRLATIVLIWLEVSISESSELFWSSLDMRLSGLMSKEEKFLPTNYWSDDRQKVTWGIEASDSEFGHNVSQPHWEYIDGAADPSVLLHQLVVEFLLILFELIDQVVVLPELFNQSFLELQQFKHHNHRLVVQVFDRGFVGIWDWTCWDVDVEHFLSPKLWSHELHHVLVLLVNGQDAACVQVPTYGMQGCDLSADREFEFLVFP